MTMVREVNAELLLGRRVLAPDGGSAGRIEEIVVEPQGNALAVREDHLGSYALMERLAATPFGRAMLDFFYGSELGRSYRVPWDKLDLADPEKPRLLCALADLETLKRA
jgi:sporulation protein YlmC with PRC-barrel domain